MIPHNTHFGRMNPSPPPPPSLYLRLHPIPQAFVGLCNQFPAQIVALAAQISWSGSVRTALKDSSAGTSGGLKACLEGLAWRLLAMSESVLGESPPALRKKYEQLITELVRQRDATRRLQVIGSAGWLCGDSLAWSGCLID